MKHLLDYIEEAKSEIQEIGLEEAEALLNNGVKVLDVREPGEYLMGTLPGAMNVPRGILEAAADMSYSGANPDLRDHRDDAWLIVCRSGGRAALAAKTMQEMGFMNVKNMLGGMLAWQEAGKTAVTPSDDDMTVTLKEPCRLN